MRNKFAEIIYDKIKKNEKIIILSGDIGNNLFNKIKKDFPNNFLNCGIAEQNMITFATGLSSQGFIPICYTISTFLIYKTFEQIRNNAAYNNNKIILVGTGSGLSYNHLGTTHYSLEDIGIINNIPFINIFSSADSNDLKRHIDFSLRSKNSSYMRIGKKNEPIIKKSLINRNPLNLVSKGKDVALICTGPIIDVAIKIKDSVYPKKNISIYNFHRLKPVSNKQIEDKLKNYKYIFTLEEHYPNTGIFSILSNIIAQSENKSKIIPINNNKDFIKFVGTRNSVRNEFGINVSKAKAKIEKETKNRNRSR